MLSTTRFQDAPLVNFSLRSAYAGDRERERMAHVRRKIEVVRKAWRSTESYRCLINRIRACGKPDSLPDVVKEPLTYLLEGFRDYANVDLGRPESLPAEQYKALEIYCSEEGYNYLYKIMSDTLRSDHASDDLLMTATTLVEFLTIDLYNLRLSQIGDPRYANFQGVTYRGMTVPREIVDEYEDILHCPDLAKRNFSVPLGLMSSTLDKHVMESFSTAKDETSNGLVRMHWTIHIHGVDAGLLAQYQVRYPDSVVTTICAMPVARVSPFGEKEILLRGPFFHLIAMKTEKTAGRTCVNLVMVMMNANRDHTSETSSDVPDKKVQRDAFLRIVSASKYEVCAALAADYAPSDADGYRRLRAKSLEELREKFKMKTDLNHGLASSHWKEMAVWLGPSSPASYPRHYDELRIQFQRAASEARWSDVEKLLDQEYDWRQSDWYNVGRLVGMFSSMEIP
ncbi:hypothetical protein IL306_011957 [Fusarium sp. DS 682]|nr:hypothetical protein IL306_011957 [Fusarium sp. DS 682]